MAGVTDSGHSGVSTHAGGTRQGVSGQAQALLSGGDWDDPKPAGWNVEIHLGDRQITRKACYRGSRRNIAACGMPADEVIWPAWPATTAEITAASAVPLAGLEQYWHTAGNRLRESAKWMATVLGGAMATVIGTSPLAHLSSHHFQLTAVLLGMAGLGFLATTMLLVLRVMQPRAVSYSDVLNAKPPRGLAGVLGRRLRRHRRHIRALEDPLYRWRQTVQRHQDLYLPCGVTCLRGLRLAMRLEEATLMKLAQTQGTVPDGAACEMLRLAQAARIARLLELRTAAASIAVIGEFYALRARSTQATYLGTLFGMLGTAGIVLAFAWPPS
jgi:hypothetical protein